MHLDPDRPARGLSIADQQIVEIAKALSLDARVLVMDEPTAALSGVEVERLFAVARSLRDAGAAVLFISHRFDEVFALCQRITVMRDGALGLHRPRPTSSPSTRSSAGWSAARSARCYPKQDTDVRRARLEVDGLSRLGVFDDVSFTVRSGEIVALAGLVGAGRSEVARAVFGVDRYDAGSVTVDGKRLPPGDTAGGDRGRAGARARGPPPAGPGDGAVGRAQRHAAPALVAVARRAAVRRGRAPRGPAVGRAARRSRPAA